MMGSTSSAGRWAGPPHRGRPGPTATARGRPTGPVPQTAATLRCGRLAADPFPSREGETYCWR